jgi:hypothetical protein
MLREGVREKIAVIPRKTVLVIYRWIEAKHLHFTETPEGLLMVCLNTLGSNPPLLTGSNVREKVTRSEALLRSLRRVEASHRVFKAWI